MFMLTLPSASFYIWSLVGLEISMISLSNSQHLSGKRDSFCFCQFLGCCPSRQNQSNSLSRKSQPVLSEPVGLLLSYSCGMAYLDSLFLYSLFQIESMYSHSVYPVIRPSEFLYTFMAQSTSFTIVNLRDFCHCRDGPQAHRILAELKKNLLERHPNLK